MKSKWNWVLWVLLAVVAGLTVLWEFVPLRDAGARLAAFPEKGFGFASREVPLSPTEKSIFGGATVQKRVYQVGQQRVVVQIVDGTRDRHAVHDPMHCFRGAGWELEAGSEVPLGGGLARQIRLKRASNKAEAMYWFSDGKTRHASAMQCWWQTALRRLSFGQSGEEPVLVILQPLVGEPVDWDKLLSEFSPLAEL